MKFEEYKMKEFKGDALVRFIAAELVCTDYNKRKSQCDMVADLVSNKNFAIYSKIIGLRPHQKDEFENPVKPFKSYANAFEVEIYSIFEKKGMGAAFHFFKNYIETIQNCKTKIF